jgi:Flp pilus assembly protein TadD
VDFYRQAIAANPDNALALNNLAFIYGESGDERAEGLARRAYELLPNSPGIMDTLGWILLNNGETTEAYQLLERAASLNPESRNTQYHLAVASSKLGDPSRSLRILRAILADDTEFAERDEAAAFLEELE